MTTLPPVDSPEFDAILQFVGLALRDVITEALALDPEHWRDKIGSAVHDEGGDVLRVTVAGETLIYIDRPTLIERARQLAKTRN